MRIFAVGLAIADSVAQLILSNAENEPVRADH